MYIEMNGPATSGKVNGANVEADNFSVKQYTDQEFAATVNLQVQLIRSRFGTTDHIAAQVAALAFGGAA